MKQVFIIGCGGSGTTLHMNILNKSNQVNICDEMHLILPRYLKSDLLYYFKKLSPLDTHEKIIKIVNLFFSQQMNGKFWKGKDEIVLLDRERIIKLIEKSGRSFKSIVEILMNEQAKFRKKEISGAKAPVNIAVMENFYKMFPDSYYIHTIRDPRAIHMSRVKKDVRDNGYSKMIYADLRRLPYTIRQYQAALKVHSILKSKKNYYLSPFEDLIEKPVESVKNICEFLKIEYSNDMIDQKITSSAYGEKLENRRGIDKRVRSHWEEEISRFSKKTITLLLKNEMARMNYLRDPDQR